MTKIISFQLFLLLIIFSPGLKAQQVIASGGTVFDGGSVSLSWTIGEMVVETFSSDNVILTQGFQQGYISSNSIKEYLVDGLSLRVYPNPTSDNFNLLVDSDDYCSLKFIIHDISGKVLSSGSISSDLTKINIGSFPDGIYLLRVIKKSGESVQSFRIIKN